MGERLIECLIPFGLSRQEATVYIFLLENDAMSGYEVSKQTGISRSNVYSALASLVEKGAACVIEGNPSKYVANEPEEFCDNRIREFTEYRDYLKNNIRKAADTQEGYITINGIKNITDKIYNMLNEARERVYISVSKENLMLVNEALQECANRQIKVVVLCDEDVKPDYQCEFYYSEEKASQLRLIVDSRYVLTGEIKGGSADSCLYCAQPNFVNVFKDALRNEIKLIKLYKGENKDE